MEAEHPKAFTRAIATPRFSAGCDRTLGTQVRTCVQKYVVKHLNGLEKQKSAHEGGKGVNTAEGKDKEDVLHHVAGDTRHNNEENCTQGPSNDDEERFGFIIIGAPAEANDTDAVN